jgi:hypothetical protein
VRVLVLRHDRVSCAIAADRVELAERESADRGRDGEGERLALFSSTGATPPARGKRLLRVTTARGPRLVECEDVQFLALDEKSLHALPEIVSAAIALPHVKGLLEHEGTLHWFVDPSAIGEG